MSKILQTVAQWFSRHQRAVLLGVGLVTCAAAITGYFLLRQNTPQVSTNLISNAVVPAQTSGHGRTSGSAEVAVPASFPSSVPLPIGTVTGVSSSPGHWSVGVILPGDYATVMNDLRRLYTAAGFHDLNAADKIPFALQSAQYNVQLAGFNRDHSNTSTDVTIVVTSR